LKPRSYLNSAQPPVEYPSFLVSVNGFPLDKFGKGKNEKYLRDQVSAADLFYMRDDLEKDVEIVTCHKGKTTTHKVNLKWDPSKHDVGVRWIHEPALYKPEFEMFGDIGVMELTVNHISSIMRATRDAMLSRWMHPKLSMQPRLVVNFVKPGSYAASFLVAGGVIEMVNEKPVRTLEEFRKAFIPEAILKARKSVDLHGEESGDAISKDVADKIVRKAQKGGKITVSDQDAQGLDAAHANSLVNATKDSVWTLTTDMGKLYAVHFWDTIKQQVEASSRAPYLMTAAIKKSALELGVKNLDSSVRMLHSKKTALLHQAAAKQSVAAGPELVYEDARLGGFWSEKYEGGEEEDELERDEV
jgi:hypothetical protein